MEPARQLDPTEVPGSMWQDPLPQTGSGDKVFNPFVGICVGLGLGLLFWAVLLGAWYAVFG